MCANKNGQDQLILLGALDHHVHSVVFDPQAKTLRQVKKTRVSEHPTWLTRHPRLKEIVYANGNLENKLYCLQVDAEGGIEILDEAESGGKGPTHLALLPDHSALLVAHYMPDAQNLTCLPLDPETGRFLTKATQGSQAFIPTYTPSQHPRLEAPHVHQIIAREEEVIACDLGCNKVWRLRLGGPDDRSRWVVGGTIEEGLVDGDGPRHAVVHPSGEIIYVLNECSSSLTAHSLPPPGSKDVPQLLSRHSISPPDDRSNPEMIAAGIYLYPPLAEGGKSLLVCTNRSSTSSKGDALALFAISPSGEVRPADTPFYWGVGRHIRGLGGDGRFVVAAGRDEGGVVVLERKGDGTALEEVAKADIDGVVVPLWMA